MSFLERKIDLMIKDFEMAFESHKKKASNIVWVRVTNLVLLIIMFGVLNFLLTEQTLPWIILMGVVTLGFMAIELVERRFLESNRLAQIEITNIVSIDNEEDFEKSVKKYTFREAQLENENLRGRAKTLWPILKHLQIIYWYIFLFIVIIGFGIRH